MKRLFAIAVFTISIMCSGYSQNIIRKGNTFSSTSNRTYTKDTLVTQYKFDSDGTVYPIIVNKSSGRCYIWKTSSKTGKKYKFYMKTEVSKTICKELDIEFLENTKATKK